eukprot:2185522-Pyramimonas_sp.AAC.1
MLSLPPNTFRKVDLLATADWSPPPVLRSVQVTSVSAAARAANLTLVNTWEPHFERLPDTAWLESTVHSFRRWIAGSWPPSYWCNTMIRSAPHRAPPSSRRQ